MVYGSKSRIYTDLEVYHIPESLKVLNKYGLISGVELTLRDEARELVKSFSND